jgi:tetratricopeptide (TPR) repeat protein
MVKDKPADHSIAEILQEETLVDDAAIQDYQEDLRLAEKERLQSNQKRGQLLEALRHSMKKANLSTNVREGMQQEFTRVIQEGSPLEIEREITQYQKQINGLQSKALVSSQTGTVIRQFFDRANVFLEKKRMQEKVEKTLGALSIPNMGKNTNTNIYSTLTKLTDISSTIRSDLLSLTGEIITQIELMEDRIIKDLSEEEKQRSLFSACLSSLNDQKKGQIISLCHKKTQESTYNNRLHFFKAIIEQLVKTNENAARKIHSHIRKEARSLLREGQYKKAVSELCYALHLSKDDVFTYRLLADVFLRLGNEKNAYVALGEILRLCPEDDRLRLRLARYWVRIKLLKKAIHEYQILLEHSPSSLSYRRELGRLLYENKSFNRIPDVLLDYLRAMPEDLDCLNYMGSSYIHLKIWDQAIFYLKQSINLKSSQPETYQVLSIAYRKLEFFEEAINSLKQGIQFNPDSLPLKILLGTVYLECEMWDKVFDILLPILKIHPDSSSLLTTIGQTHYFLGNIEEAIAMLTKSLKLKSGDPMNLVILARTYRKKGDVKNAEHYYEEVLQHNKIDTEVQQELASFYVESGQWQKATELLRKNNDK